jgi:hypothetical protein
MDVLRLPPVQLVDPQQRLLGNQRESDRSKYQLHRFEAVVRSQRNVVPPRGQHVSSQ